MARKYLKITREGQVAICAMSNPPEHTMVAEEVEELHGFLDEIAGDADLRVCLFRGAEDGVFIKHYEVGELVPMSEAARSAGAGASPWGDALHPVNALCQKLQSLDAITIAAINGNAAGGGFEFALAYDFRLLMEGDFLVGLPETSVGIIPGAGGTQRMARLLGVARALDLILHGRLLPPKEALAMGLAHRVFPAAGFHDEARAFAEALAARAPKALQAAKRAIYEGAALSMKDALLLEQARFQDAARTEDATESMRAYLEGSGRIDQQAYDWKGR